MYKIGQEEIDAVAAVLNSGNVFRYGVGSQCARFEERYGKYLDLDHVLMTSSGTAALTAALVGLRIGPGDEVLVPACTYMATAVAVLGAGAIPVIVDIDESITIDPDALEKAVTSQTRAVIPVHMWGLPCDMDAVMAVAGRRGLAVVEDACQAVGGCYDGRKLGSIGDAGAFSFNYYKNMTCGEGGAVVTRDKEAYDRMCCMVDCCKFYWAGRDVTDSSFVSCGSRASEIEGAILNVQLDRIDEMVAGMRQQKKRILNETADTGLQAIRANSLDHECGSHVMYILPDEGKATAFAQIAGCGIAGQTGRHVYTEWDQVFAHQGAHHPALNPYNLAENKGCRKEYTKDMCRRSLEILNRTVMISTHPDFQDSDVADIIAKIRAAAAQVLA